MQIEIFNTSSAYYPKALALRYELLRKPLGLEFSEIELEKDKYDAHFGLIENEEVLACLTLTECDNGKMKMRQVSTKMSEQGKGLGKKLAAAAEYYSKEKGFNFMFCHARKTAVPFYESMGYKIVSQEFTEVGIPHFVMEKPL